MVPKAVQDAGYTAVGLGVLALQEVQIRRRATKAMIEDQVQGAKALIGTVTDQVVKVPLLVVPPICGVVAGGRSLLERALGWQAGQN